MSESKLPSGIDRVVGQRIRWRRRELKLSQEQLAELLSLTFQQVQKYEKGVNRVSAGRLFEIASVMGVTVNYFYDGAESELEEGRQQRFAEGGGASDGPRAPVLDAETLDLIAAFQKIEDDSLRKSLLNTVRAAASAFEAKQDED
ncbi:helix-turn-helix transcriptional regulator [uncultured Hyphomonas sp.]|uniref:helix-turn-helix domain-containing protein n=1 Tax=uncultured Hyphomonas sp. TaxID=225298 RepID=UPI002AABC5E7|nr:helix-turn-helix transcriptional regulator [uncultured Hyphomonas sp.]